MREFQQVELDRMRSTQVVYMQDLAYIQDYVQTIDAGEELKTWEERTDPVPVGVNVKSAKEMHKSDMEIFTIDGQLRLPLGIDLEARDRIRIVRRFGENIDPMIVAIVGTPQEGVSSLLVDFTVVDPGENR